MTWPGTFRVSVGVSLPQLYRRRVPSASANSFIASKYVRDIARFGGDVSSMVTEGVIRRLKEKYA